MRHRVRLALGATAAALLLAAAPAAHAAGPDTPAPAGQQLATNGHDTLGITPTPEGTTVTTAHDTPTSDPGDGIHPGTDSSEPAATTHRGRYRRHDLHRHLVRPGDHIGVVIDPDVHVDGRPHQGAGGH
ncbi:hypothetical protein [Kitasatospora sp. NPDC004289]